MAKQKYSNSSIARKAIIILLNREHPFKVRYNRDETRTPLIEITFEYRFQGEKCTFTVEPEDTCDLMEIRELIRE